ncbi:alpha-(1-_3)-arabinofuranosyltransferase family protein [Actinoplanes sp. NPDC051513]|uniref:alpha-(1->3)-arabinofuranosyltransferase domain-containing protein n=1 Tax=Actinoplanes sp. NPDC051513 TaxID=3363908 RepID=UPI003791D78A
MTATVVWRLRVATCCVLLTALSFWQQPGRIVPDTKVDLVVAPGAWLARVLHAWDPSGNFGQMQNQAYGYLWPMGPFFALGKLLGVPAWAMQRLWWALLLCAAFTGVVLLAGRLGIGTPAARLFGGVVFALSPRILSELGPVSVEAWPTAVAPWVLLPLVGLARGPVPARRLLRAVALSALAVATAGGVNATAVVAVLPLPLLWLLTVRPWRWRIAVAAAWGFAVACATAWWVVPLLLLGRYSPPFLEYIETAATTTRTTDVVSTVRGASHWLAYLGGAYGPGWPAGWRLAVGVPLVVATMVVAGLGLAGLSRRGLPHRRFLIAAALAGVAVVGLGHLSAAPGAGAESVRVWLDAGGAPLRNLHKFDVLLRLPLVLGFTHLLGIVLRARAPLPIPAVPKAGFLRAALLAATAGTALAVAAGPALAGGLPGQGTFAEVPQYWRTAAAWLDAHAGAGRTLVVPGARFPSYLWGAPGDEMVQPLMRSGWAVRNSIPLVPPTTVRFLDTVESVLASGQGSPGLAAMLSRSGVRYLLVRADLDTGRTDSLRQLTVRAALAASPGLRPVTGFGPPVGGQPAGSYVDRGLDIPVPALAVYEVAGAAAPVGAYDLADTRTVVGGPESLLALADAGRLSPAPTMLASDQPAGLTTGGTVVTDGLRRREVNFGQAHDNASATMTATEPWRLAQPAHDYTPTVSPPNSAGATRWQTVARYLGVRDIEASSSYSQALTLVGNRPEHLPYAAVDGDPATSWRSAPGTAAVGQWLTVTLDRPRRLQQVRITFDLGADAIPTRIAVRAGNERHEIPVADATVTVPLEGWFAVTDITIEVTAVWSVRLGYGGVGLAELAVPGVSAHRTLVLPAEPGSATTGDSMVAMATRASAPSVLLGAAPSVPSCFFADGLPYCAATASRGSEDGTALDRTVPWSLPGAYTAQLWGRPRAGPALDALLDRAIAGPDTPWVTASSTGVPDPAARAGTVVDGNPDTVWYASDEDRTPWLRLDWASPRTLTGLRITLPDRAAAAHPWAVTVLTDAGSRSGTLDAQGQLRLDPPVRTDELTVLFGGVPEAVSFSPYANRFERLPVGVGEVTVLSDRGQSGPAGGAATVVRVPCGSGPALQIGDRRIRTAFTATVSDLLGRRELPMRLCETDQVKPGTAEGVVRVVATASAAASPARLALLPVSDGPAAAPVDSVLSIDRWDADRRRVTLAPWATSRILVLRENTNAGWRARIGARTLRPIVVDGWQQGWIVPAGLSGVATIEFAPDGLYRAGLAGGAVLAAAVVLAALPIGRSATAAVPPDRRDPHRPAGPDQLRQAGRDSFRPRGRGLWRRRGRGFPGRRERGRRGGGFLVVLGGVFLVVAGGYAATALALLGVLALLVLSAVARVAPSDRRRALRRAVLRGLRWAPVVLFSVACLLSLRSGSPHVASGPQLAGLAAFAALWLGTLPFAPGPARSADRAPAAPAPAVGASAAPASAAPASAAPASAAPASAAPASAAHTAVATGGPAVAGPSAAGPASVIPGPGRPASPDGEGD